MPQPYIDFAYVKEHAAFERVIAGYNFKLLGSGTQRSVLCPFHRERKPSCKIELDRKIFHCFGCEAKGNILEFVARLEGDEDDLRGAALKIAELCGIATAAPRQEQPARQNGARRRRSRAAKAWSGAAETPSSAPANKVRTIERAAPVGAEKDAVSLTNRRFNGVADKEEGGDLTKRQAHGVADAANPPLTFELKLDASHPYLAERGLSAEVIAEFGLGYCNRGVMAGRICVPIHDAAGQLVAYAGRWPEEEPPEEIERYKLPVRFEKSRVLFNLHRVGDAEHIVLVEGYWSAIRLHTLGLPVAALMGWSVSAEQLALLRERGVRFVTLLLDGDDAGRRARERVLPDLASAFFVRAPLLPDGQKPDTLPERALRELVDFDQ